MKNIHTETIEDISSEIKRCDLSGHNQEYRDELYAKKQGYLLALENTKKIVEMFFNTKFSDYTIAESSKQELLKQLEVGE